MVKAGFIGWRGMVGSVLLNRIQENGIPENLQLFFFSTSSSGQMGPSFLGENRVLLDASNPEVLETMDLILCCQGREYTKTTLKTLRDSGWDGYWLDASSYKRMDEDTMIVLDPVNRSSIEEGLDLGIKNFAGGNCTVSLMLLSLQGLFKEDLIEWVSTMTYQAASGAGSEGIRELLGGMKTISDGLGSSIKEDSVNIMSIDKIATELFKSENYPVDKFGVPLGGNLIPWIDEPMDDGSTREEWKGMVESNRILDRTDDPVKIDGQCVRVGTIRCHSQAFTIRLKENLQLKEIEDLLEKANPWVEIVPNNLSDTLKRLNPVAVSGTLKIPVGRLRKLRFGEEYLTAFTVGDQLLWGAAEPLKRMFYIISDRLTKLQR